MNVFIYSNHTDWEQPVITHFQTTGLWNKVITTSNILPANKHAEGVYMRDANFSNIEPAPHELFNNLRPKIYQFMDMYSRNSKNSQNEELDFSVQEYYDFFHLLINFFHFHFTNNDIDLALFNRAPHTGTDFVAYSVAKELNIRTLMMEQSRYPNRFFYYWDNDDFGTFNTTKKLFEHEWIKLEQKFEKDLIYMKGVNPKSGKTNTKIKEKPTYKLLRELFDSELRGTAISRFEKKKAYRKNREALFSASPNLDESYVYFGLHMQPEKTTSNWGGIYNDQILALEKLAELIPDGWKIYVKENPKQDYFMRSKWVFKRLKLIPKVVFVPTNTSTYDLLKNSEFAATITGTLGWEAITGGKKVLAFGWGAWYKSLPGVAIYSERLDLEAFLNEEVAFDDVEKQYNKLMSHTAPGVIYNRKWHTKLVENYSKDENIETIKQSLETIFKHYLQS